jgi:hypothetical protein
MLKSPIKEKYYFTPLRTSQHPEQANIRYEIERLEELLVQYQNDSEAPKLDQQIQKQLALVKMLQNPQTPI